MDEERADSAFIQGDFDSYWEYLKQRETKSYGRRHPRKIRMSELLATKPRCSDPTLSGKEVLRICAESTILTDYEMRHRDEIEAIIDDKLQQFRDEHGRPFLSYFVEFHRRLRKGEDAEEFKWLYNSEDAFKNAVQAVQPHWLKSLEAHTHPDDLFSDTSFAEPVRTSLRNKLKLMVHEAQRAFRERHGKDPNPHRHIPESVHGSNTGESHLCALLMRLFPNETVEKHAMPGWLAPQHFDVYLPDLKIAIEYHGLQHFEPVETFGGQDAFEDRKARDEKKAKLADENDVTLLYVRSGYRIEEVLGEIRKARDLQS